MKTPILTTPLSGPATWKGAELKAGTEWLLYFTEPELQEIDATVKSLSDKYDNALDITPKDLNMPLVGRKLAAVREELENGRGFQVLRGLPVAKYSLAQNERLIWALSLLLGEPEEQDKQGNLIHSVYDKGKNLAENSAARGYETDQELTFHNDGGDAFMLLCLKTAVSGGVSKLMSVNQLFNEILRREPQLAKTLQQPFHFDTREQHPDGRKIESVPIFNFYDGKLSALYKRAYIDMAQRFPDVPRLSEEQIAALNLFDEICNEPDMQMSFSMEPGDIQVGNNYSVLHSRTKYLDHENPEDKRRLFRTWLTLPNGRALPPVFADTREFVHSYRRRQAQQQSA